VYKDATRLNPGSYLVFRLRTAHCRFRLWLCPARCSGGVLICLRMGRRNLVDTATDMSGLAN
jgi:hypothetical protein